MVSDVSNLLHFSYEGKQKILAVVNWFIPVLEKLCLDYF